MEDILNLVEELICAITENLANQAREELNLFSRNTSELKKIQPPLEKLTYEEALKQSRKKGENLKWGQKIDSKLEKKLSLLHKEPLFIVKYPVTLENQFFHQSPDEVDIALVADLLAPEGYGEIGSGGQVGRKRELMRKMGDDGVNPDVQKWYLSIRNSNQSYSAFAIGIERYIQWLCKLPAIEQTILFPRTNESIYP